jgi:hypothetical protein
MLSYSRKRRPWQLAVASMFVVVMQQSGFSNLAWR